MIVVWDLGRVLIDWQPQAFYDARIGPAARSRLFDEVPLEAMNLEVDRGWDLSEAVEHTAARHPAWADEIRLWRDAWGQMIGPEIAGSVALLEQLRARGVRQVALTNFGRATFEIAEGLFPFLGLFERRFVSAHLGVVKPDPAIYAHVEDGLGTAPDRLLFVDDRPENVAAATARGWSGHVFDGPAGWARRLSDAGLL